MDLARFLDSLPTRPRLLGLGEPTHGVEEFLRVRNEVFRELVEREGYRSIAIESDCLAGLIVDDWVAGGPGTLDDVMATGFSHGFGASAANRELVGWMRSYNATAQVPLRFDGFDGPVELGSAASPRGVLSELRRYLAAHLDPALLPRADVDHLVGSDDRWTDPAAGMDPSLSVGDSVDAAALRLLADDLAALVDAEAPGLIAGSSRAEWDRARLHARTATGLLRFHAGMADPTEARMPRLGGVRDAMMAANLAAVAGREARRGPTLVFAHNGHLQRTPTVWAGHWQGKDFRWQWWGAGAITAATAGSDYAFVATAVGSIAAHGVGAPGPDTVEGVLAGRPAGVHLAAEVAAALADRAVAARVSTSPAYAPLHPVHLDGADAVLFLPEV